MNIRGAIGATIIAALLGGGCAKSADTTATTSTSRPSTTSSTLTPSTSTSVGDACAPTPTAVPSATTSSQAPTDPSANASADAALASKALIGIGDLPSGCWNPDTALAPTPDSASEYASLPLCASNISDVGALGEKRSTIAALKWRQGPALNLEHDVELYPTARPVKAIEQIAGSPQLAACIQSVIEKKVASDPTTKIMGAIDVSTFDIGVSSSELGVDFVAGVTVKFNLQAQNLTLPVTVRILTFGIGRGLGTVTVNGSQFGTMVDVGSIDLQATARAGATNLASALK